MKENLLKINLKVIENIIMKMVIHEIGFEFYSNGNIIYEGGFTDNKREGIGKYYKIIKYI